jgi:hypothetical protein
MSLLIDSTQPLNKAPFYRYGKLRLKEAVFLWFLEPHKRELKP